MTNATKDKIQKAAAAARQAKAELVEQIKGITSFKQLTKLIPEHPKHFNGLAEQAERFADMPDMLREMMLLRLGYKPHTKPSAPRVNRNDVILQLLATKRGKTFTIDEFVDEALANIKAETGREMNRTDTAFYARLMVKVLVEFGQAENADGQVTIQK